MLPSSLRRRNLSARHSSAPSTKAVLDAAFGAVLDADVVAALAPFADVVEVGAGTQLARAGTIPRQVVVLVEGQALVQPLGGSAWNAGPGERFGACEVRAGAPLRLSATTISPSARVLVVFGPAVAWALAGLLTGSG